MITRPYHLYRRLCTTSGHRQALRVKEVMMDRMASSPARGRPGRPTKAQTVARHAELLTVALDHFLDKGYDGATIEAIAAEVQMTKRTIYARYPDKASLFLAAVFRAIEYSATPRSEERRVGKGWRERNETYEERVRERKTTEHSVLRRRQNTAM